MHPKIIAGRLIWIPVRRDRHYLAMSAREMIVSENYFRQVINSISDNQIQFCCSLIQYFLKGPSGKSVFMDFLLDGSDVVEDAMPDWVQNGWKRKISTNARLFGMVRLIHYICCLPSTDPKAKDLFEDVFGSVQEFNAVIVDLLNRVDMYENVMAKNSKKQHMSCFDLVDFDDKESEFEQTDCVIDECADELMPSNQTPTQVFLYTLLDKLDAATDVTMQKVVYINVKVKKKLRNIMVFRQVLCCLSTRLMFDPLPVKVDSYANILLLLVCVPDHT